MIVCWLLLHLMMMLISMVVWVAIVMARRQMSSSRSQISILLLDDWIDCVAVKCCYLAASSSLKKTGRRTTPPLLRRFIITTTTILMLLLYFSVVIVVLTTTATITNPAAVAAVPLPSSSCSLEEGTTNTGYKSGQLVRDIYALHGNDVETGTLSLSERALDVAGEGVFLGNGIPVAFAINLIRGFNTLLLPTDAAWRAFAQLTGLSLDELFDDAEELVRILNYHVMLQITSNRASILPSFLPSSSSTPSGGTSY